MVASGCWIAAFHCQIESYRASEMTPLRFLATSPSIFQLIVIQQQDRVWFHKDHLTA
jgi:hypothetical protein